jgi:hypothetical protein
MLHQAYNAQNGDCPGVPRPNSREVRVEILPGGRSPVSLVLDSSATLAWTYGDETTEQIRRVFQAIADDGDRASPIEAATSTVRSFVVRTPM